MSRSRSRLLGLPQISQPSAPQASGTTYGSVRSLAVDAGGRAGSTKSLAGVCAAQIGGARGTPANTPETEPTVSAEQLCGRAQAQRPSDRSKSR